MINVVFGNTFSSKKSSGAEGWSVAYLRTYDVSVKAQRMVLRRRSFLKGMSSKSGSLPFIGVGNWGRAVERFVRATAMLTSKKSSGPS